jgi:hypothetical protein
MNETQQANEQEEGAEPHLELTVHNKVRRGIAADVAGPRSSSGCLWTCGRLFPVRAGFL